MGREERVRNIVIVSIVVVAVLTTVLIGYLVAKSNSKSIEKEFASELSSLDKDSESASTQIGKSVEESEKEEFEIAEVIPTPKPTFIPTPTPTNKEKETTQETANEAKKKETKNNENAQKEEKKEEQKKEEKPKFEAPLKGEIIRGFAKDSLVFSNTLQEWITHNAVDVKADKTSVVKAAADGIVYAIKNDPRYGLTVIINHAGGYQTIYSNLLTAEFVVKGEEVKIGQTIGTVGNSAAFEISDDYHLHFELLKDNEPLDPTIYMEF